MDFDDNCSASGEDDFGCIGHECRRSGQNAFLAKLRSKVELKLNLTLELLQLIYLVAFDVDVHCHHHYR